MRTTTELRRLVTRPEIAFLMEAHDGLSARVAEEAGFEGIWASGLTLSASFGVRDNNELSWAATALSGSRTPFAGRVPTEASAARPSEIC